MLSRCEMPFYDYEGRCFRACYSIILDRDRAEPLVAAAKLAAIITAACRSLVTSSMVPMQ